MKRVGSVLLGLSVAACGPMVGVSRSVSLEDYPDPDCVVDTVAAIPGVSFAEYSRLSGDDLRLAQYEREDAVVIHEYRYDYETGSNSFQFVESLSGSIDYRHQYRSDRSDSDLSDTDELVDFMMEVEEALEASCGVDLEGCGTTKVCARLFGGCPTD